jgi:hypothetical protein
MNRRAQRIIGKQRCADEVRSRENLQGRSRIETAQPCRNPAGPSQCTDNIADKKERAGSARGRSQPESKSSDCLSAIEVTSRLPRSSCSLPLLHLHLKLPGGQTGIGNPSGVGTGGRAAATYVPTKPSIRIKALIARFIGGTSFACQFRLARDRHYTVLPVVRKG